MPLPDFLRELEDAQMALIENILASDISVWASIFALAVTPAICEELLFRGYLQRQLERSFGVAGGIIVTGVLFGLYHFRLTQAIPLAVLGIFLGWLVWRTGSLWIPILVHFCNNAFAVAASALAAANPEWGIEDVDNIHVPPSLIVGGALVVIAVIILMNRRVSLLADLQNGEEQ
jgi:membrane protease YdiL (CAAX protease family)